MAKRRRIRRLADDFQAEHAKGMDALARRDYDALGKAIHREAEIIAEQKVIAETMLRAASTDGPRVPNRPLPKRRKPRT